MLNISSYNPPKSLSTRTVQTSPTNVLHRPLHFNAAIASVTMAKHDDFCTVHEAFRQRVIQAGYNAQDLETFPSNMIGRPTDAQKRNEKRYKLQLLGNDLPVLHVIDLFYAKEKQYHRPQGKQGQPLYMSKAGMDAIIAQLPELIPFTDPRAIAKLHEMQYNTEGFSPNIPGYYALDASQIPGMPERLHKNAYLVRVQATKPFGYYNREPAPPQVTPERKVLVEGFNAFLKDHGISGWGYVDHLCPGNSSLANAPVILKLCTADNVETVKQGLLKTGKVYPAEKLKRQLAREGYPFHKPTPLMTQLRQSIGLKVIANPEQYDRPNDYYSTVNPAEYLALRTCDFKELSSLKAIKAVMLKIQYEDPNPPSGHYFSY